jgi:hypothetical protein
VVTAGLILAPQWATAGGIYQFREAAAGNGQLKYINELPVLLVQGSPEEIGRQKAELTASAARRLLDFPRALAALMGRHGDWSKLLVKAREMARQFPADHRRELEACAEAAGVDRDKLLAMNTLMDIYGGFGCSSLIAEADRSATASPIFGRNLDIFSLGVLQHYSLVVVYRPEGKHAFVSVGFPGVFGAFSGMNERGLALALHGVFWTGDGSPNSDPHGIPCTMLLRRVLEECATVEEAEALLRKSRHTTVLSVVLCDRVRSAVAEVGPGGVAVRQAAGGICACTNHFRAGRSLPAEVCPRYAGLLRGTENGAISVDTVARKLHEVHQGGQTVQTMIFEPGPLRLHLAIGSCPSSALPLKALEVAPLLGVESVPASQGSQDRR